MTFSDQIEFIVPQPTMWRKDAIETTAERIAEQVGFAPGDDIQRLILRLGGKIEFQDPTEWFETESGSIVVHGPRNSTIYVSNFTSRARDRFTIAHELGHFVLHSNCGRKRIKVPRSGSNRLEWEANWFAAGFLMPSKAYRSAWKENSNPVVMAAQFGVSIKAAEVRKDTLGLTTNK